MSYNYQTERPKLFTEEGVEMLRRISNNCRILLKQAGAVRYPEATAGIGDEFWTKMACLDYLVEKGELREVTGADVWGQDRVFVAGGGQ